QKAEFLLETRLGLHALQKFSIAFPMVKSWVERDGWTTAHAVQYLSAYVLGNSSVEMGSIRDLLASRGLSPDFQAEALSHLVESKGYRSENSDPRELEHLLDFLSSRAWSVEDSFEVLNNLAKNCGDAIFSHIPALLDWMRGLEQHQWRMPEIKELVMAFTKNSGSSPGSLFSKFGYYVPRLESRGWDRPSLIE